MPLDLGLLYGVQVERIDLGWNGMGSEIGVAAAAMLDANSSVCELILNNNNIMGPAGVTIAGSLINNRHITQLDLSLNYLDDDVFDVFSKQVLSSRSVLKKLDLYSNFGIVIGHFSAPLSPPPHTHLAPCDMPYLAPVLIGNIGC